MVTQTNKSYKDGGLETILNLAPTSANFKWLSTLFEHSEKAIEIVNKIAFEHGPFG